MMKEDIMDLFQELREVGSFAKYVNSFFLVLVAKIGGAHNINDFRLVNVFIS